MGAQCIPPSKQIWKISTFKTKIYVQIINFKLIINWKLATIYYMVKCYISDWKTFLSQKPKKFLNIGKSVLTSNINISSIESSEFCLYIIVRSIMRPFVFWR